MSALATIQREGPLRPGDLSRIEVVTKPTMTRILTELEQRGFIAREADPRDGRAFMVSATDEGIAACWISVDGDGDRWGGRLPGLVARLTWKLEYLGWIERGEDGWVLSAVGAQALDAAS